MNSIGHSALNLFRELLLNFQWHNRSVSTILGVRLVCALRVVMVGCASGRVIDTLLTARKRILICSSRRAWLGQGCVWLAGGSLDLVMRLSRSYVVAMVHLIVDGMLLTDSVRGNLGEDEAELTHRLPWWKRRGAKNRGVPLPLRSSCVRDCCMVSKSYVSVTCHAYRTLLIFSMSLIVPCKVIE